MKKLLFAIILVASIVSCKESVPVEVTEDVCDVDTCVVDTTSTVIDTITGPVRPEEGIIMPTE